MRKNLIKILLSLTLICVSYNFGLAIVSNSQQEKIDTIINKLEVRLEDSSYERKNNIYSYLKTELNKRITTTNKEVVDYVIQKIGALESKNIEPVQEQIIETQAKIEETNSILVTTHNSVILRFTKGGNHESIINSKKQSIEKGNSVFIFRNAGENLSIADIKSITSQLVSINPDVLIFIDQEGGVVNRYVDFESAASVQALFDESYIVTRFNKLSQAEKNILRGLFPQTYGYFPSLGRVGVAYDSFLTNDAKVNFVEIIAYIRLKTLENNGINTYGLVADLNLGNPAITNAGRSFSKHVGKYKILIDAFQLASKETGVSLYLKHFPGHGAGLIDSHKGILDLRFQEDYLKNNIELFDYFLDTKIINGGLMVGHIIVPDSLYGSFTSTLNKADYILTDDLAMQGYKQMTGINPDNSFFSSHKALEGSSIIKVDTQYVESVY